MSDFDVERAWFCDADFTGPIGGNYESALRKLEQVIREDERKRIARPEEACRTCNDDPAVCATVPGLRHCEAAQREIERIDPGTHKLLRDLLDRIYKINLAAIPSLRVGEYDPESNDPLVAWMSDARLMLYGSGRKPDIIADLQGSPLPQRDTSKEG